MINRWMWGKLELLVLVFHPAPHACIIGSPMMQVQLNTSYRHPHLLIIPCIGPDLAMVQVPSVSTCFVLCCGCGRRLSVDDIPVLWFDLESSVGSKSANGVSRAAHAQRRAGD